MSGCSDLQLRRARPQRATCAVGRQSGELAQSLPLLLVVRATFSTAQKGRME